MFFECIYFAKVLLDTFAFLKLSSPSQSFGYLSRWLLRVAKGKSIKDVLWKSLFSVVICMIWLERNALVFNRISLPLAATINKAINLRRLRIAAL